MERLRWRTGAIGCLFPFLLLVTALFAIAAVRPSLLLGMAESRRGAWLAWTDSATVAGVNLPIALLAAYLAYESFRFGWRWADEIAVTATPFGLVPHRSLLMRPMAWSDIEDVRFAMIGRVPLLLVQLRSGRSRAIRGVDNEDGIAEKFALSARERVLRESGRPYPSGR